MPTNELKTWIGKGPKPAGFGGKDGKLDLRDMEMLRAQMEQERAHAMSQPRPGPEEAQAMLDAAQAKRGGFMGDAALEARVLGPMMTRHFSGKDVQDYHPGAGGEVGARWPSGMGLAAGGYYQEEDSFGKPAWWGGLSPSYQMGDPEGWWVEPGLMLGGISKQDYNQGELSPFVLPRVAVGWKGLALDGTVLPATGSASAPVAAGMLRLQKKF